MTSVTVKIDPDLIAAAAAAAGIDTTMPAGDQVRAMLRQLAGQGKPASAIAEGGNAPVRAGREWENKVIDHAAGHGYNWQRTRRRGARDLLDVVGCIDDGWLIGCKGVQRGVSMNRKLWAAMDQAHRAMVYLPRDVDAGQIIPLQVIQRPGVPVGQAYAVTEYDWFLQLADMRRKNWQPDG